MSPTPAKLRPLWLVPGLITVALLLLLHRAPPAAAQTTTVTVSPAATTISGCETGTVDVLVNNVTDLYGVDITLQFDPGVLAVIDAQPGATGVQVHVGSLLDGDLYVVRNQADNSAGTIEFIATLLNPTPPANGSGPIISIDFGAAGTGSSSIAVTAVELVAYGAVVIPAASSGGSMDASGLAATTSAIETPDNSSVRISWTSVAGTDGYAIYRSTTPYFVPQPGNLWATTTATQIDDPGALGDLANNFYYVVQAACDNGLSGGNTNRVGEYDHPVLSGSSGEPQWNTTVIPFDLPNTSADDLAAYIESFCSPACPGAVTNVAYWNTATGLWVNRTPGGFFPLNFSVEPGQPVFFAASAAYNAPSMAWLGPLYPRCPGPDCFQYASLATTEWNFLMLPLDKEDIATADGLAADIDPLVGAVAEWRAAADLWAVREPETFFPVDYAVRPGQPYFIRADGIATSSWPNDWP